MTSLPRILCMASILSACGGGSPGSVTGVIHGTSFSISDAISATITNPGQTGPEQSAVILMSTTSNLCADLQATPVSHPNEKLIGIILIDVNGTTFNTPTAPGTYTIFQGSGTPPAKAASFGASVLDATCKDVPTSDATATTGTVTLSAVSGNVFSGSFDVTLDSGDHVTGSFDPEECPGLQAATGSTTTPSCM